MRVALWILGALLVFDLLFVGYFHVFRAGYYFPGRYEDALAATLCALLSGLPVLGSFAALPVIDFWRRKRISPATTEINKGQDMQNLFAYGTLMCEDIMGAVSGCRLSGVAGILRSYRRRPVKGEHYPALVPDKEGCVTGVVYLNLPAPVWDRLDRFEGRMYIRQHVKVEMNEGILLPAETYVLQKEFQDRLEVSEWDFEDFLRSGKKSFQLNYRGYRQL